MKKLLPLFLLLALACKSKNEQRLPTQKMEEVLLDVNIAEAYSTMNKDSSHVNGMKNMDSLGVYYKDIFARHNITYDEFMSSMKWYMHHENELDTVYNHILIRIEQMVAAQSKIKLP